MKITRLKKGYRISLNDSEFEALSFLVGHGQTDMDGVDIGSEHGISGLVLTHLETGRFAEFSVMRVDEDRRPARLTEL